jgi:hypothetical protein
LPTAGSGRQDAYTTSGRYPHATPASAGINYIRNSVKVTVDAYNGTTTFYLVDPGDPMALTLQKTFPSLLAAVGDARGVAHAPALSAGHLRDAGAHVRDLTIRPTPRFYNKEDQWRCRRSNAAPVAMRSCAASTARPCSPGHTIMKLPGEKDAEFIQMLPFTPRNKDNLASWMVARSDGENYGQLVIFQFPKQKVVYGPRQVIARINQDQNISPQITLWSQQGSEVIQGTLLVIPIEESLLYIRPLYLRSEGGRIPELKRVIVAYQNRIVMEPTLGEAIARIFPPGGGETKIAGDVSGAAMVPPPTGELPAADVPATTAPNAAPGTGAGPRSMRRAAWRHRQTRIWGSPHAPTRPTCATDAQRLATGRERRRDETGRRTAARRMARERRPQ